MTTATTTPERRASLLVLAVGVAAVTAVGLLLLVGSQRTVDVSGLTRWGLPVARVVHDLAAALTVGLLTLGAWAVGPERGRRALSGPRATMIRMGAYAAGVWCAAGVVVVVLTTSEVAGVPIDTPGFGAILVSFVTQVDLGRALGVSALLVAVVGNLALLAVRATTAVVAAVLSLIALLPLALAGHAAGSRNHMNAVDSLALHLIAVSLWVGGLAVLILFASRLGAQLPAVARRYSTLAGVCFVVVAASGIVNALLRLDGLGNLGTSYGRLVVAKTVALLVLGVAGYLHRRTTLGRLAEERRLFVHLAVVEVLVMAATTGLAVALSRSATPEVVDIDDPATALLGYPAPPPLTVGRYLGVVYLDVWWLSVALGVAVLYLAGVLRLRRRGDRWPLNRILFWLAGCALLVYVTGGGPGVYGRLHFSTHMIQHMTLMVLVPLLFVFGAPITLAMRALTARSDGSFGPREMLLVMVHSRPLQVLGHPIVAEGLFLVSLPAFYYTGLFELAMFTHVGHVLMTAHFLLSGYLFIWSLVGLDPGPTRPAYPVRFLMLFVMLAFHAFFGISLMSSGALLAPSWWHALGHNDDAALLVDQQLGGSIVWGAGDLPALLLGLALLISWYRSDARETRQSDRRSDRDGDAELRRYNEQLAGLTRRPPRS